MNTSRRAPRDSVIIVKSVVDEDFQQYKHPSMLIGFPFCTFKCGQFLCQNAKLADNEKYKPVRVSIGDIVDRYINNPITKAVVLGGLEPLDSLADVKDLMLAIREQTGDDIVIYTGYEEQEPRAMSLIKFIQENKLKSVVIKFGRYVPDDEQVFDETLGVTLASKNQYAVRF